MLIRMFFSLAILFVSATSHAEIALLCGDLEKIEENEKNAAVHVDFDGEIVNEVKFLYQFGIEQNVTSFAMQSPGTVKVSTEDDVFVFHSLDECEGLENTYVSYRGTDLPCACYSD